MRKPIIGIVAKPYLDEANPDAIWHNLCIQDEFRQVLCALDAVPLGILPEVKKIIYRLAAFDRPIPDDMTDAEKEALIRQLRLCDGILLQGGRCTNYYEIFAAQYAIAQDIPLLGICAGFNCMVKALGATTRLLPSLDALHTHEDASYRHPISIVRDSAFYRLFPFDSIDVNSFHSQYLPQSHITGESRIVVNAVSHGASASAASDTDTVECFTVRDTRFAMAIRWHPEVMEERHWRPLFEGFLAACGAHTP